VIDASQALVDLQEKYPDLSGHSMRVHEYGWANRVVFVGERLIFRFPRTEAARGAMQMEQAILPALAKHLPLPIPQFLYQSEPDDPISFVGYELLPGQPLTPERFTTFTRWQKADLARELGAFLSALHQFPAASHFPDQTSAESTRRKWQQFYSEIQDKVFPLLAEHEREWTRRLFTDYLEEPAHFAFQPCLLHADFTSDHLLAEVETGRLCGVIDFGDMEWGDPAYDFAGIYVEFGQAFTEQALAHYRGDVDSTFLTRIEHFYRKRMPFHSILHALETGEDHLLHAHLNRLRSLID